MTSQPEDLPQYYIVGARPVQLLPAEDGGMWVLKFDWETGLFIPGTEYLSKVLFGTGDIDNLTEEEFIHEVEKLRRERFTGNNAVFALYQLVDTIIDTAKAARRPLTEEEEKMIELTNRTTYHLFEKESRINENYSKND